MAKTKFDFIADILKSDKLRTSHKEKFLALAIEELRQTERQDSIIWQEIEELKRLLLSNLTLNPDSSDTTDKKTNFLPKHHPKDVADFMTLFNQRDGLKYLTHDFDEEGSFDIVNYLNKTKKTFNKSVHEQYSIPKSLYSIIKQFAFTSNPAWRCANLQNINTGWSTYDWINWSSTTKLHPIRNEQYKATINSFRQLIRIESPFLEQIIERNIDKAFGNSRNSFQIEMDSLKKADFYTHVPSFEKAIFSIFDLMKSRDAHKEIKVKYLRSTDGDYFIRKLEFHQLASYPTKELDVLKSEWNSEKGAMGGIRHNLYGYCHWSVETKIEDKATRVNILKDDITPEVEILSPSEVDGFKHTLTFFYR
jgi:hypothetical protein